MRVYRLENNKGFGPYASFDTKILKCLKCHDLPEDYNIVISNKDFYFGWQSKELMKKFFKAEICDFVKDDNWKISIYDVDEKDCILIPDGQIAFKKNKMVDRFDIKKLFK